MAIVSYQRMTGIALAVAVMCTVVLWSWGDRLYRAGAQGAGWAIGMAGLAVPPLVLACCAIWLRRERRAGHAAATVPWLKWVLGLTMAAGVGMLLFSLM